MDIIFRPRREQLAHVRSLIRLRLRSAYAVHGGCTEKWTKRRQTVRNYDLRIVVVRQAVDVVRFQL